MKRKNHHKHIDNNGKCDNPFCTNYNDGTYGSGRFCSSKCAHKYVASKNPHSEKRINHLKEVHLSRRAEYGRWKCDICNLVLESRMSLKRHKESVHGLCKSNGRICPYCKKEFKSFRSANGHIGNCILNPFNSKDSLNERHKKTGIKLREMYANGELKSAFLNKRHTKESKIKMRESTLKYLKNICGCSHRYNKKSITILESIAKEHGWNIQHAENGGEFYTGIGYFVDAYDKEKNIIIEYDERYHYKDVKNNILKDKDFERQKEIIEHLHCEFWRYNEYTGILWKAN